MEHNLRRDFQPMRLQTFDVQVFPHPSLCAGDFNSPLTDWGYNNSADGDCQATWANSNNLALLYNPKDKASFHSYCWNSGTNPDLVFCSIGPDGCLTHKRVLEKFLRLQDRLSLITSSGLTLPLLERPLSTGTSFRHTEAITFP